MSTLKCYEAEREEFEFASTGEHALPYLPQMANVSDPLCRPKGLISSSISIVWTVPWFSSPTYDHAYRHYHVGASDS
jgi:hypothetical protein